ncbi:glycosyltransferase family 2 protein [Pseudomonas aeruginosa]|uniref:glycosyltransferase family 2 protein n=1 Tax=Pseudomonas aeruginosa TaxID=287 RepID=UPI00358F9B27
MVGNTTVERHLPASTPYRLSLLVPAHSAQHCLPPLVSRLLAQSTAQSPIEIVVSSDDGFDYASILPSDKRIVFAESGLNTGPATARNRALAAATGTHVCMMDADDSVSGLFLATVFKGLALHPAFAVRSVYVRDGAVVRAFLERILTLESYVSFYGSVLVVAPRDGFPEYQDVLVEDGLSTLAVMHSNGGVLPVVNAEYRINLHEKSYCASLGHTFTARYRQHLLEVGSLAQRLGSPAIEPMLRRMYKTRLAMSVAYDTYLEAGGWLDYHGFVSAAVEERLPGAALV